MRNGRHRSGWLFLGGLWALAVLSTNCCSESKRNVAIAGSVSYNAFQAGEILVTLSESESSRCSGGSNLQIPGVQIAETALAQPGAKAPG